MAKPWIFIGLLPFICCQQTDQKIVRHPVEPTDSIRNTVLKPDITVEATPKPLKYINRPPIRYAPMPCLSDEDVVIDPLPTNVVTEDEEEELYPLPESYFNAFDMDTLPSFPGGKDSMAIFIKKNRRYPVLAHENRIQGYVVLGFVVDTLGAINYIRTLKTPGGNVEKEAIRMVGAMPRWNPGIKNGRTVAVYQMISVQFKLEDKL